MKDYLLEQIAVVEGLIAKHKANGDMKAVKASELMIELFKKELADCD